MTPEQEYEYIQQAQKAPKAFIHLYDHYFPRIHAYVRYRIQNTQDAEDLVADTFFEVMHKLKHFKWHNQGSFAAWIFRIAHNSIVDYYRKHKAVALSLESSDNLTELTSHIPLPEDVLTREETFQRIRTLIMALSPRRQEIITLKFFGGLRNCDIANILGLDERTVASHLSRGLQDLQRSYTSQQQSRSTLKVAV